MKKFLCVVFVFSLVSAGGTVLGDSFKLIQDIVVPMEYYVEPGMLVKEDGSQVVYIVSNADKGDDEFGVRVNNTPLTNTMLNHGKLLRKQTGDERIPTDPAAYRCTSISDLTVDQKWMEVAYTTFLPDDSLFLLRNELKPNYAPSPPFCGLYPSYFPWEKIGARVAFFMREDNKMKLIFDQRRIALEEGAMPVSPAVFSKDGKRVAYVSTKKFRKSLFVDEKKVLDDQDFIEPVFHPKGNGICYIARKGDKTVLVIDGKTQKCEFTPKQYLTFSPKEEVYAYVAKSGSGVSVIKNGARVSKELTSASSLAFDATGAKLAYVANNEGWECVMVDGKRMTAEYNFVSFSKEAFEANGTLVFAGYDEEKNTITVGKVEAAQIAGGADTK